jgi:hypothetical protein
MLIDVILLRLTSMVHDQGQKMDIIPNIPVESIFEMDSAKHSFSGAIDFLLARGTSSGKFSFIILHPF